MRCKDLIKKITLCILDVTLKSGIRLSTRVNDTWMCRSPEEVLIMTLIVPVMLPLIVLRQTLMMSWVMTLGNE